MTALAHRYALFDPEGVPILNAVGIWTDLDLVRTYAGTVFGHDGSWPACAAEGYTIRRVAIIDADGIDAPEDVALLRAARRILLRGQAETQVMALALCTVERLDSDPQMLAVAAQLRAQADAAADAGIEGAAA